MKVSKYYIDCEFDGHNGPLLSIAIVREDGRNAHLRTFADAKDEWVIENVIPHMNRHHASCSQWIPSDEIGPSIKAFLACDDHPVIIADSPVDIARFCVAISTGADGHWESADYPRMTFEVHNVDCYPTDLPGAVQHNAWWDAMALRHLLQQQ